MTSKKLSKVSTNQEDVFDLCVLPLNLYYNEIKFNAVPALSMPRARQWQQLM
jgi:hypothetical protein